MRRSQRRVGRRLFLAAVVLTMILFIGTALHFTAAESRRKQMRAQCRPLIEESAARHHLPGTLITAVIQQESRFNAQARGGAGEVGLMQITAGAMADWAAAMGVRPPNKYLAHDPGLNIEIGAWYLGRALQRWRGYADAEVLALAEYNAGISNARRWAPDMPATNALENVSFPGTRHYIDQVLGFRLRFDEELRNDSE